MDLVTLMYWSNAELYTGNHAAATDLIQRARDSLQQLAPGPVTASLARQIAEVGKNIEQMSPAWNQASLR